MPSTPIPIFGAPVAGVTYKSRLAAYAVIRNSAGAVAAVQAPAGYWLPGGGALPGETLQDTVRREVQEELRYTIHIIGTIGEAVQYFFAATEHQHYVMRAVFLQAEFVEKIDGLAEYAVCWLDVTQPQPLFFHACHDWAARRRSFPALL
jgi:8-oxo-dGTP diphosphatase